jgi:hypothetical protein
VNRSEMVSNPRRLKENIVTFHADANNKFKFLEVYKHVLIFYTQMDGVCILINHTAADACTKGRVECSDGLTSFDVSENACPIFI